MANLQGTAMLSSAHSLYNPSVVKLCAEATVLQNLADAYQACNLGTLIPAAGKAGSLFTYTMGKAAKGTPSSSWAAELRRTCSKLRRFLISSNFQDRSASFSTDWVHGTAVCVCIQCSAPTALHEQWESLVSPLRHLQAA